MYWRGVISGAVCKAGMDGSNPTTLVGGCGETNGIHIDFQRRRIYSASYDNNFKQSINLNGGDVVTIHELPDEPFGLAILGEKLYRDYYHSNFIPLKISNKTELYSWRAAVCTV